MRGSVDRDHVGSSEKGGIVTSLLGSPAAKYVTEPGGLIRMVGDELTTRMIGARLSEQDDARSLAVTCGNGVRSCLTVQDDALVRWEFQPPRCARPDVGMLADIATLLLTGHRDDRHVPDTQCRSEGVTFKGAVGRELRARGLTVALEIYPDDDVLDVIGEVVAVGADAGEEAKVRINDNGELTWERDYWPEFAVITWESGFSWDLNPRIGVLARAIVETVAPAIFRTSPARNRRKLNGG